MSSSNSDNSGNGSGRNSPSLLDTSGNQTPTVTPPVIPTVTPPVIPTVTPPVPAPSVQHDISWNLTIDASGHVFMQDSDPSCNDISFNIIPIVSDLSMSVVDGTGYQIKAQQGTGSDNSHINRVTFSTTEPEKYDPQIYQNLTETITTYNDETDPNSQTNILLNEIRAYATEIQCTDFQGKGSIDDYKSLFQAASRIATESKHMELDIDIDGFNDFANAADDLSELFQGFIIKLQNVNIITDLSFLISIKNALFKIVNLSNIFGKFKQAVFNTTTIQLPKSAHDTKLIISDVMDEVNCAMNYINYFVDPSSNPSLGNAQLSEAEKNIISKSAETIDNWNTLCEYGVSIAMANDVDVQFIENASTQLKQKSNALRSAASSLRSKLAFYNITC